MQPPPRQGESLSSHGQRPPTGLLRRYVYRRHQHGSACGSALRGRRKVWNKFPDTGPAAARDAYTGTQFRVARRYAEAHGSTWFVLSAKYGFISPETLIENYDVAFSKLINGYYRPVEMAGQVSEGVLNSQARQIAAANPNREIVCLVADAYRVKIERAFAGLPVTLKFPIAGLRQHAMMAWMAQQRDVVPPEGDK